MTRLAACLFLSAWMAIGCDGDGDNGAGPAPAELDGDEIGYYCNMIVANHLGPKGQIFLTDRNQPLWFSSARDAIAFTMLPGEPKNISAVYVSDMGKASWDRPEPGTWVDARSAWFVIGSDRVGAMGAPEPVPFSDKTEAEAFRLRYGGRIVGFADIPENDILGFEGPAPDHSGTMKPSEGT